MSPVRVSVPGGQVDDLVHALREDTLLQPFRAAAG